MASLGASIMEVPALPVGPVDWMAIGCEALSKAVEDYSEADAWVIGSVDGDTVDFALQIKLVLGVTLANFETVYSASLSEAPREFLVRPEEWRRQVELGDKPKRGLLIFVPSTNEFVELMPDNGLPVYDVADNYSTLWKLRGKVTKPGFTWSPPE